MADWGWGDLGEQFVAAKILSLFYSTAAQNKRVCLDRSCVSECWWQEVWKMSKILLIKWASAVLRFETYWSNMLVITVTLMRCVNNLKEWVWKQGNSRTRIKKGSNVLLLKVAQYPFRRNLSSLCKSVELKKAEQRGYIWMSHMNGPQSTSVWILGKWVNENIFFWSWGSQLQGADGYCEIYEQETDTPWLWWSTDLMELL